MKKCLTCENDFTPYVGRQRFCCTDCAQAFYAAERRQAVAQFRQHNHGNESEHPEGRSLIIPDNDN